MIQEYLDQRQKLDRKVVERAMQDAEFRTKLVADPRAAIASEFGYTVPANTEVRVVEETAGTHYVVVPAAQLQADGELNEEALEAVAGGGFELLGTFICVTD